MPIPFEGGCLCGAIRYRVNQEPVGLVLCHCTNCQKQTASDRSPVMFVPVEGLEFIKGETKTLRVKGSSGNMQSRHFCFPGHYPCDKAGRPDQWCLHGSRSSVSRHENPARRCAPIPRRHVLTFGDCGSPIMTQPDARPEIRTLKAGTIDDPSWLEPTAHIWVASAPPYALLSDDLPHHPGNLPA